VLLSFLRTPLPPSSPLFPYTTLFRSLLGRSHVLREVVVRRVVHLDAVIRRQLMQRLAVLEDAVGHRLHHRGVRGNLDRLLLVIRSEEHTSELQSRENLVCRLLLEKKK